MAAHLFTGSIAHKVTLLFVLLFSLLPSFTFSLPSAFRKRTATPVAASDITALAPFTQFASAAYCDPSTTQNWTCGEACNANPSFKPTLTGGDGNAVQFYYVGYNQVDDTIIVAHQGTHPEDLLSLLTDGNILQGDLDSTLFPGIDSSLDIKVHDGFADEHAKTAQVILTEVKRLLATGIGVGGVVLIGHSLGGALAELDSLFMTLNLPSDVKIKSVTFGTPRVGNPAYATFFDSKVQDFTRVNHNKDPVPTVPGRDIFIIEEFQHPHGEIHLLGDGTDAVTCSGDDDATDSQCTIASVPNILDGSVADHLGPYNGISIGSSNCS